MSRMQDKRSWLVGGAMAAAAVSGAGWFFLVSPVLSDTDSVHQQTSSVHEQNRAAQRKIDDLARKASQLGTRQKELTAALAALPTDNGLPEFTRQLSRQAGEFGVRVRSVDVGAFTAAGASALTPTTPTADSTTSSASTTTSTTTPPAGTSSPAIVAIQVTVTSDGTPARQVAFLNAVQAIGPRRALVTNVAMSRTSPNGASWTMTTTLSVFATPKSTAERTHIETLLHQK